MQGERLAIHPLAADHPPKRVVIDGLRKVESAGFGGIVTTRQGQAGDQVRQAAVAVLEGGLGDRRRGVGRVSDGRQVSIPIVDKVRLTVSRIDDRGDFPVGIKEVGLEADRVRDAQQLVTIPIVVGLVPVPIADNRQFAVGVENVDCAALQLQFEGSIGQLDQLGIVGRRK